MRLLFPRGLRFRLILLVLLAVIPALGMVLYGSVEHQRHEIQEAKEFTLSLAQSAANLNDNLVESGRTLVIALAQHPEVKNRNVPAINRSFANLLSQSERYTSLLAVGLDGVPIAGAPKDLPVNFADRDWFQRIQKTREPYVSSYLVGKWSQKPVMALAAPVFNPAGELTAIVVAGLDLSWLQRHLAGLRLPPGAVVLVADREGTVLARHPDPMGLVGRNLAEHSFMKAILAKDRGVVEETGLNGVKRVYGFSTLGREAGEVNIAVGLPKDELLTEAHHSLLFNLVGLGLAMALALAGAWFVGGALILRPAADLLGVARRLEEGDLTARTGPPYPPGELGGLGRAFDGMAAALEQRDAARRQAEEEVRRSESRYRSLVENIKLGITVIDADYKIITVNPTMGDLRHKPVSALIGKTCFREFHQASDICPHCPGKVAMATGRPAEAESESVREDGSRLLVHIRAFPHYDAAGKIIGFIEVLEDITRQRLAEEELATLRRKRDLLLDSTWEGIVGVDQQGDIIYVNPAAAQMLGYEAHELLGRSAHATWHHNRPDSSPYPEAECPVTQILKGELGYLVLENVYFKKDGSSFPVMNSLKALMEDGAIVGAVVTFSDLTQQKLAEAAKKQTEAQYHTLVETSPDGIFLLNLEQQIIIANRRVAELLGYDSPEALLHRPLSEIVSPQDWPRVLQTIALVLERGEVREIEHYGLRKDGTIFPAEVSAAIIRDAGGQPYALMAMVRDISKRKLAEEGLRESEQRYRRLVHQVPAVVFKGYADWSVDFFDRKVEDLTGYAKEDFDSRRLTWKELIFPEDLDKAKQKLPAAVQDEGFSVQEYRIRKKDGEIRWIDSLAHVIRDAYGKIDYVTGILFDITDRKAAEEKLVRYSRALQATAAVNEALIRATAEETLLQEICRIIIEMGGYRLAWVGYAQQDEAKTIKSMAVGGAEGDDADWLKISWGDDERGRGPSGMAVRTGQTQVVRDILAQPGLAPWHDEVRRRGYNSVIALPLKVGQQVIGILAIHSQKLDAFNPEESHLLDEIANNLSYGIETLRTRTARQLAESELEEYTDKLRQSLEQTVQAMATTVEVRDPYTSGHQRRVTQLAQTIAREMGLSPERQEAVWVAGTLHDLGKIYVPAVILTRPGRLDPIEFELIKTHCQKGYEILRPISFPWPIAQIVKQHHEKMNGSGYPEGLKGEEILLEARILAVADVVEAMASHRPYRAALGIEAALEEITKNKGTLYDPEAVEVCVKLFTEKGFRFKD